MLERLTSLARTLGPHLRAALLLPLCFVTVCAAFPMPGPNSERALKDVAGQQELEQWVDLLGGIGIQTDKEQLGEVVMWLSRTSRTSQRTVTGPFQPFFRFTQTQQGWGLFAYPDTHPHTLVVEGREDTHSHWRVLYRSQDPEHQWLAGTLHFRRVRALYNPGRKPPGTYGPFVDWLAVRAFEDHPELEQVRVYFTRTRTPLPWETQEAQEPGKRHRRTRKREDVGLAP